jgi:hypothetical protein
MRHHWAIPSVILLAAALPLAAQQATIDHSFQDPRVRVTTEDTPDGKLVFSVQNRASQSISAYAVEAERTSLDPKLPGETRTWKYYDCAFYLDRDRPLSQYQTNVTVFWGAPGQVRGGPRERPRPWQKEVTLLAVLFEDGSSAGDPAWVARLVQRRKVYWEYLGDGFALVQNALATHEPAEQILKEVEERRSRLRGDNSGTKDSEKLLIADLVYREISVYIQNAQSTPIFGGPADQTLKAALQDILARYTERRGTLQRSKPDIANATPVSLTPR